MNLPNMLEGLQQLRREWDRNAYCVDVSGKPDWVRGVAYGVKLAHEIVLKNVAAAPTLRGSTKTPY
jgi:hypothetical protein